MNFNLGNFRNFIIAPSLFKEGRVDVLAHGWRFFMVKYIHLTQTTINHAMHINAALSSPSTFSFCETQSWDEGEIIDDEALKVVL